VVDTRPGLEIDDKNICFPCKIKKDELSIDWGNRRKELDDIIKWAKPFQSDRKYDCIVSVSGGKDSTRQALLVKDELKLKPLLVSCVAPPDYITSLGIKNLENLIKIGFDCISVTPSPQKWRLLARESLSKYGNILKASEMALYATAPRVGTNFKIPLIFLGENNALTYGDGGGSLGGDANNIKNNNTLSGGDPTELLPSHYTKSDVIWHYFPSDKDLKRANIRLVYLGYYFKDFNNYKNTEIALNNGLELKKNINSLETGSIYNNDALDDDFQHVNQLLKYLKFGFSKVTDEMGEAIRLNLVSKDKAEELIKEYDGRCSFFYINNLCKYLGLTIDEFWDIAKRFINTKIWTPTSKDCWVLKHPLYKREFKLFYE
tara:strand:- start:276 stop:1400 length:1125 start_codon:yes stop_codon:yes gene_type:complete